jgi:starvation-inducible outer membrane lipoprotein
MKREMLKWFGLILGAVVLQGCISIPPLINVQHKESNRDEITRRLDSIDRRLERLEQPQPEKVTSEKRAEAAR